MNTINFPNIFNKSYNSTTLKKGNEGLFQDLELALLSFKKEMLGDPYYGTNFQSLFFNLNDLILRDLVIDEIYSSITLLFPQIILDRKNINIVQEKSKLKANILFKLNTAEEYTLQSIQIYDGSY